MEKSVINSIMEWNSSTGRFEDWKVVPEMLYFQEEGKESVFLENIAKWCKENGTIDQTQSLEERGAVGQAYIVNGADLMAAFNFKIENV
jgi:hypothetical protein